MTEEKVNIIETTFMILKMTVTIGVIVLFIILFGSFRLSVQEDEIDRVLNTLAEGMDKSYLTVYPSVYKLTYLLPLDKTITEPVSFCDMGAFFSIKNLDNDQKISFGYKPSAGLGEQHKKRTFPIGIVKPFNAEPDFYNSVNAGEMTIDVYKTPLATISCIAEKSYKTKKIYNATIECVYPTIEGKCNMPLRKTAEGLCLFNKAGDESNVECRQADINLFSNGFEYNERNKIFSIPLKSEPVVLSGPTPGVPSGGGTRVNHLGQPVFDCGTLKLYMATGSDTVVTVGLCAEAEQI